MGRASDAVALSTARPETNPFPGLRPFGADEAHLFFGREQHVEGLLSKLGAQRMSAVVGICGSGKSSLVFAGVLPRLMRGYRVHGIVGTKPEVARSSWRIASMRPGDDPIGNLARALYDVGRDAEARAELPAAGAGPSDASGAAAGTSIDDAALEQALLSAQLQRSQAGLSDACRTLGLTPNESLLLIVDQFEELFRFRELCRSRNPVSDPAAAFVQLLLRATEQVQVPIYVLLTMRSDFIGECVQFTGLAEAINEGQFLLPLLNRDQRELVIRGPLAVVQAPIAPALVQRLLNDAGDMTDQLPVLQHALMRSFELWRKDHADGPLHLQHYELAGGMQHALSKHADEALAEVQAELGQAGLQLTEKLFRALTERGAQASAAGSSGCGVNGARVHRSGGRGVRRPCRVAEVLATTGSELAILRRVVERFTAPERGFLIVQPATEALSADSVLDISHEALMRAWDRLQTWTDAEFAFASQLHYLHEAEDKFVRGIAGLWRDPELSLALGWVAQERPTPLATERYGVDLGRVEAFLEQSAAAQRVARATEQDARLVRRVRRMFSEAKLSTLIALLAIPLVLLLQGSGILDGLLPFDTRLKLLSVAARYLGVERSAESHLAAVVIDDDSQSKLQGQTLLGQPLGPMSSSWRGLHAQVLGRLVDAGAKVVVFDIKFSDGSTFAASASQAPSNLVGSGTAAFAEAITDARSKGTTVVVAAGTKRPDGTLNTEPTIARALRAPGPEGSRFAPGYIASPCLGFAKEGAALFVTLLTTHPGQAHQPSLALAALSGWYNTPDIALDRADRTLFLHGGPLQGAFAEASGGQRDVAFAGFGRTIVEEQSIQCPALIPGDVPAQQIVDVSVDEWVRGSPGLIPFESILADSALPDVAGKIVLIGTQLSAPSSQMPDRHAVLQCGSSPWSCRWSERWGMNLHLDALNSLLRGRAIQPMSPLTQMSLILTLCVGVVWQRMRHRQSSAALRRLWLLGFIALDLVLVVCAAVFLEVLMDEIYHVLAMIGTYIVVGRLDKH